MSTDTNQEWKEAVRALKTPDLEPCPFCGGKAYEERSIGRQGEYVGYFIRCGTCSIRTKTYNDKKYWIETSHNFFCPTDNLLAARAWNMRVGKGMFSCNECGVEVPHTHKEEQHGINPYQKTFTIILLTPTT